ncbi:alpha/beta hydrolase [Telluribacter sp. SYSU D00476]|uniref:alpha/beta hydrolase n=1 Tax=Telluribacter sp. SYSU D00476 TaxID=2811430 RepID=UPI001FF4051A|nr:phospholipase [Telluribacter sp. SYSU D00476]
MDANKHHLPVSRTATYYTLGKLGENTRRVWFVLHGYGQLAQQFIKKFGVLDDGQTLVVAPEALSRFYLENGFEHIGASWMTREERELEIDDYVSYLDQLYQTIMSGGNMENIEITLLGFSQGSATACRWLDRGMISCDRLILWAGHFANGLTDLVSLDKLPKTNSYFVYGEQDQFLSKINVQEYMVRLNVEAPDLQIIRYQGGHAINEHVLKTHFL